MRVVFTPPTTIGNHFHFKDKTPFLLQSLVVYLIRCAGCDDFYIGKTARCLTRRILEHKKGIGNEEMKSALYKHHMETGHTINYDEIKILAKAATDNQLLLKEMLLIDKLKPTLNVQKKSALFSLVIGSNLK